MNSSAAPHLLMVTTTRAVWLLDPVTRKARQVDRGRGVYYGITFDRHHVYVSCRQAPVGADRDRQDNAILRFDANLDTVEVLRSTPPMRDVHQLVQHDGTLYACSTYDDAIHCYDLAQRRWSVWQPFGPGETRDRHHINSILPTADGFWLAGNRPDGWVARFTPDRQLLAGSHQPLGAGSHNVWMEGGEPTVCSSDDGAILTRGHAPLVLAANAWLRGFARDRDRRYVGVSQNRVRQDREHSDCMILQLDSAGVVTDRFSFFGFGMLHDIRVMGLADQSHNGLAFVLAPGVLDSAADVVSSEPIALSP